MAKTITGLVLMTMIMVTPEAFRHWELWVLIGSWGFYSVAF